jgi:hypothetical protein
MSASSQPTSGGTTGYGDTDVRTGAPPSPWVTGLAWFAGALMIVAGLFHALSGLVALFRNQVYIVGLDYVFSFDLTTWGWIHLVVGVLVFAAGCAVLAGQLWGRLVGITLAVVSMIVNFLFIPYYPVWAILIIALGVFVIWALCSYDRDVARR